MNLRQFRTLLRQQYLFSGIYILCTGLSTGLTMTLFLVLYVMFGPVYPEMKRNSVAMVKSVAYQKEGQELQYSAARVGKPLADSISLMPEVECVSSITGEGEVEVYDANDNLVTAYCKWVDCDFWRIMDFRFQQGRSFTREEWQGSSPVCVISEGLARKLLGRADVVGEQVRPDLESLATWTVVGVVEDVSRATPLSYAQLWLPNYNRTKDYERPDMRMMGSRTLAILLKEGTSIGRLQQRVGRLEERVNQEDKAAGKEYMLRMHGQPDIYWKSTMRNFMSDGVEPFVRKVLFLLLAFLLIPAMNMGSMVASRVNARTNEMGIRRAYGATRGGLVWQVLQENFLLTFMGSLLGLTISWAIVTLGADWLPFIFIEDKNTIDCESVHIHADMLFSGWIIGAVVAASMVLNLVSALIPAVWILHKPVTEEINYKK